MTKKERAISVRGDYGALLMEVKKRIRSAQYEALKAVNRELTSLYWDIGRMIAERQRNEGWGQSVVEKLAADLREEYPGSAGFSASNLWRTKLFYETYQKSEKLAPLVREIGWSHNIIIKGGVLWLGSKSTWAHWQWRSRITGVVKNAIFHKVSF